LPPSVLHLSNSAYSSLEGTGPSLAIYRELARGFEHYHVLARSTTNRFARETEGNLTLHLVPGLRSSATFLALAYAAIPIARSQHAGAIVAQDPLLGGLAAVHAGRLLRLPTLLELHTDVYFRMASSRRPLERLAGRTAFTALRSATRVRVGSRNLAPLLEAAGVRADRVVYVPYRTDLTLFDPTRADRASLRHELGLGDGVVVASVGRFVEQKGYGPLIDAFAAVAAQASNARLVLAGGGPLRAEYEDSIRRHGLDGAVCLLDWISREDQVRLLRASDIYVQPSIPGHGEWMPRTILEAMAMRLPVVASDMAGISDVVVDGRTGMLVPPGDRAVLATVLASLASDAPARASMGAEGRREVESLYEWGTAFERYRQAISSLTTAR
jgi:glycosyltransferase involved in cell wall biosynthesis